MNKRLISIIIPTFNRAHIIGKTLDSIIVQSYAHWECIVVDDGSTDNTAEVIASYMETDSRFKFYHRPGSKQKGPSSCRNFGFKKSKGTYINFFDSDDLLKPEAFERWLAGFTNDEDAVISKIELVDFNTYSVSKVYEIASDNLIQDFFLGKINFFVCGPLWRKDFLDKQKNLFNESIRNGDDLDFNLRMLYQIPKLKFLEQSLLQIRVNPNSLSKERNKLNKKEIISYFNALDYHFERIKAEVPINKNLINDYIISQYSTYLLFFLTSNNKNHSFLYWRLLKKEVKLGYFKQMFKTSFGYLSYLILNKGFTFVNFKSQQN